MNLARAKMVLIIAFAGLNLFLAYHLFWPDIGKMSGVAVTADDLQSTEDLLKDNNYILETSIDRSVHTGDFLTVSPDRHLRRRLLQMFIEEEAQIDGADDTTIYRLEDKTAMIHDSGLLQLVYESPGTLLAEEWENLEESELRDLVKEFLEGKALLPEGIKFDYIEYLADNKKVLNYYQVVDDTAIFSSRLRVVVEADLLKAVELYWLQPADRSQLRDMQVISAAEALASLVNALGPGTEERVIKHIEIGYYSGEYDAEKWEIPPVWRIVLDDGQSYYINAFTGNMEQKNIIPEQLSGQ